MRPIAPTVLVYILYNGVRGPIAWHEELAVPGNRIEKLSMMVAMRGLQQEERIGIRAEYKIKLMNS